MLNLKKMLLNIYFNFVLKLFFTHCLLQKKNHVEENAQTFYKMYKYFARQLLQVEIK